MPTPMQVVGMLSLVAPMALMFAAVALFNRLRRRPEAPPTEPG